ncbi:hypothetical protein F4781DRAFT_391111 [Annulohypoxylon bovei var. microspora]|nr:hypothetical protein F4781DRAFT_391111 [Annulohypoxylon bovei var. microspora]
MDTLYKYQLDRSIKSGSNNSRPLALCGNDVVLARKSTELSSFDKEWAQEFYPFSNRLEKVENQAMRSRDEIEKLEPQARKYRDQSVYQVNKRLDDCFKESGMKVFRCSRPNCRQKDRQCDACLERHETFQDEGMAVIFHPEFWTSSYIGSLVTWSGFRR